MFLVSIETNDSINIFGLFLKPSWAEKKGLESSRACLRLRRVAELQKTIFEDPQSQFHNFFSPQFWNQCGCPQYCGIAEVQTKIVDAHLWQFSVPRQFLHFFLWQRKESPPIPVPPPPPPHSYCLADIWLVGCWLWIKEFLLLAHMSDRKKQEFRGLRSN